MKPTAHVLPALLLFISVQVWRCNSLEAQKIYLPGPEYIEDRLRLLGTYKNDVGYTLHCYDDDGLMDAAVLFFKNEKIASITFGPCSPLSAINWKLSIQRQNNFHRLMKYDGSIWTKYNIPDNSPGVVELQTLIAGYTTEIKAMSRDKPGHRWKDANKAGNLLTKILDFSDITPMM